MCFATLTKLKNSKWMLILFIWLGQKKNYKNVSIPASGPNGLKCDANTVYTVSEQMRKHFSPRTCCSKHRKHDKREVRFFKEEFRCTEVLCLQNFVKVEIINLAVNDWTNAHWTTLEMVRWQSIDKYWMKQWIWSQIIEDSKTLTTQLQLKNKLKKIELFLTLSYEVN